MNRNIIKTLLERFSCSLIGRGKKIAGHRILLRSLFMLREKNEKGLLSLLKKKDQIEKIKMRSALLLKNFKKIKDKNAIFHQGRSFASLDKASRSSHFKGLQDKVLSNQNFTEKNRAFLLSNSTADFKRAIIKPNRVLASLPVTSGFRQRLTKPLLCSPLKSEILVANKAKLCKAIESEANTKIFDFKGERIAKLRKQELITNNFQQKNFVKSSFTTTSSIRNQKTEMQNKEMHWLQFKNSKICQLCVDKAKPILETRKIRKGRITHRIPIVTNRIRQQGKAISSLIQNAVSRKKGISIFLNPETNFDNKKLLINSSWFSSVSKIRNNFSKRGFVIPSSCAAKNTIKYNLAEEFFDAGNGKGQSVEKRKQLHIFALQNRASLHFRWW